MDSLLLDSIRVATHIGTTAVERKREQELTVTVEIFHSIRKVAAADDTKRGIDYANVIGVVEKLAQEERQTLERFAEDVASAILKKFKPSDGVKVSVWKNPPLPLQAACVTIRRP